MTRDLYLALGDSITAGYNTTSPGNSFVARVSRYGQTNGLTARTVVIARNGWTSRDLLRTLGTLPQNLWQDVQLVTLCIGGNDLRQLARDTLFGAPLTWPRVLAVTGEYGRNFLEICSLMTSRRVPHVLILNLYNPVPKTEFAAKAVNRLNSVIEEQARAHDFPLVDVRRAFQGREAEFIAGFRLGHIEDLMRLFKRPIHPNDRGHQVIASLVQQQLLGIRKGLK